MVQTPSKLLSSVLAATLVLWAPGLSSYAAAAQVVSARALAVSSPFGVAGTAIHRVLAAPTPLSSLSLSPSLVLSPVLGKAGLTPAPVLSVAAAVAPSPAQRPVLGELIETIRADAPKPSAVSDWRLERLFEGTSKRPGIEEAAPVDPSRVDSVPPPALVKAVRWEEPKIQVPSNVARPQAKAKGLGRIGKGLLIAAFFLAMPALAMAAGVPAAIGLSASTLVSIRPLASGIAAVLGAVYGLIVVHRMGEPKPSAGQILASVLRYGVLAGAGVYTLLDVTQIFFFGFSALNPLTSAVATAALGQSAFQGKFADASTTSADRLMGAFPAIAAAVGLSVGLMMFSSPPLLVTLALGALSITGVSSAVYAALFKPGKSPAKGPNAMARGYVLQTLMTGLALAVSGPYLTAAFVALAAWGFGTVLSTVLREAKSNLPDWLRKLRPPKK